jgi:uncharacterized protein
MKKWLKRVGYTILVLFVLLNIMSAFHAHKFTHFYANAAQIKKPEEMGFADKTAAIFFGIKYPKSKVTDSLLIPHCPVTITTIDSLKLEAWYAQQRDSVMNSSFMHAGRGTVIMFHGHGSSKSGMIKEATTLYNLGYDILMVDFRAHGNSSGEVCTIGVHEAKDVKAAYDFIEQQSKTDIILWGISLGAATITKAVSEFNLKPTKIVLEMPFGSLSNAVEGRVRTMGLPEQPICTLLSFWGGLQQGFWAFNHKPSEYVKQIHCPVLLQWGVLDKRVTNAETELLFANIASKNKKLIKYETCGHVSLCKNEYSKWVKEMGSFLVVD